MFNSRTKTDLMIEVWEFLDCESVGAKEIIAIEDVIRERFGNSAVDSPMKIARLLADEGAELRHSEIMELFIERSSVDQYAAMFRNILKFGDFKQILTSIHQLENLRKKFLSDNDKDGLRLIRETALKGKQTLMTSNDLKDQKTEMAEWLTIWLQSPEIFENWVTLRINSKDFNEKFGE